MPNDLPLPDELAHLLEKRDGDDRRQSDRRDSAPVSPVTAETEDAGERAAEERRSGYDRRLRKRRDDDGSES